MLTQRISVFDTNFLKQQSIMVEIVTIVTQTIATLTPVITKLVEFLGETINDRKLKNDAETLSKDLNWIQAFLKDELNKPSTNSNLSQMWLNEVSKIAKECDNVVNGLLLQLKEPTEKPGCLNLKAMSSCCISYEKDLNMTHKLRNQIKKLISDFSNIKEKRNYYNPNAADVASTSGAVSNAETKLLENRKLVSLVGGDEHVVGLPETIKDLTAKLTDRSSDLFLISVLGMGGIGKTTLVRKLYDSSSQDYFEYRAWICVSQQYSIQDLLKELINSIAALPSNQEQKVFTSIPEMEIYLRKYLMDRRFLVVIDDVWGIDAWDSLKRAFPNKNNGSKVIITTRNNNVASLDNAHVHNLRFLYENESWELLCSKVLSRGMKCPSNLEKVGNEMVSKCQGLPLAIIVLGGILSRKSLTFSEWTTVRDNFLKELEKDSIVNAILTLSLKDLPGHLLQCFLYVAMFPEDFGIERGRLMLLCEAEGFIENGEEGNVGDAIKSYFNELLDRCLISKRGGPWIGSTFQIHDLLRDLALRKAREMDISIFYDGKRTTNIPKAPSHTRLTVYNSQNDIPFKYTNKFLQTLFGWEMNFDNVKPPLHKVIKTLPDKFRMLRVLDVRISTTFIGIPRNIGDLIHLRFLSFDFRHMPDEYEIPKTIGNLKALQTLSISEGFVRVPEAVLKLRELKHFIGKFIFSSDKIGSLVSLETLSGITGEQWCRLNTTELVNIRYLTLWNIKGDGRFYDNFINLGKLRILSLYSGGDKSYVYLEKIFQLCPSISHLETIGINFHDSLSLNKFAVNLQVVECELPRTHIEDTISVFGKLPQLEALQLFLFGQGKIEEVRVNEGFSQLRFLKVTFHGSWFFASEGCMPLLEHLDVYNVARFKGPHRMMRLLNRIRAN